MFNKVTNENVQIHSAKQLAGMIKREDFFKNDYWVRFPNDPADRRSELVRINFKFYENKQIPTSPEVEMTIITTNFQGLRLGSQRYKTDDINECDLFGTGWDEEQEEPILVDELHASEINKRLVLLFNYY